MSETETLKERTRRIRKQLKDEKREHVKLEDVKKEEIEMKENIKEEDEEKDDVKEEVKEENKTAVKQGMFNRMCSYIFGNK